MRVTIVPVDSVVGIDGEFRIVAGLAAMYPDVHAVQWGERGESGHVEYQDGSADALVEFSFLQPAIDAWRALTPPPPTAEELLQAAISGGFARIESAYKAEAEAPISYAGLTFQADEDSVALMAQVATAIPPDAIITWYDVDNVGRALNTVAFAELRGAILMRAQPLFAKKQALKAAIRAATTVSMVEEVVW